MDRAKLAESRKWIQEELDRCVSFWLNNGMDPVNGGVLAVPSLRCKGRMAAGFEELP